MQVKISGHTAIDEPCICRRCGHHFMTQEAVTKADPASGQLVAGLLVCCPTCFSDDVIRREVIRDEHKM